MIMRYHHCGIPTKNDFEGAIYLPKFKMHVSDHLATPIPLKYESQRGTWNGFPMAVQDVHRLKNKLSTYKQRQMF